MSLRRQRRHHEDWQKERTLGSRGNWVTDIVMIKEVR